MDQQTLLALAFTVGAGALSGGITNAVAIWMLFHPYDEVRIGPFRLHGAISKNKARLARSIGKTVGERLLTPEDVAERLGAPAVRAALTEAIDRIVRDLLARDLGSLTEMAHGPASAVLEEMLQRLGPRIADGLAAYAGTPEFRDSVTAAMEHLKADLGEQPVGAVLTPARREAIRTAVDGWATSLTEGESFAATIGRWLTERMEHLEQDPRPVAERLPEGLLAPLEQAITDYLPAAIERLGATLQDPTIHSALTGALRQAFDGAARDLLLHERLLARLVVKPATFERLVSGLAGTGVERLGQFLRTPAVEAQLAATIRTILLGLLRMPVGERLAALAPDTRANLVATVSTWAATAARSPAARESLQRAVDHGLDQAGALTWARVLSLVPVEEWTATLAEAARSERGRAWVAQTIERSARQLAARPLGRPVDWLPPESVERLVQGVAHAAWDWIRQQIPQVVERLEVPAMVEQKVLGFSTARMEEIIRGVTQRELRLIVRLGYVLGGLVGLAAFGINRLF